ncbi:MAG TPA: MotA/TolQ/ExbB proton channel family protein [Verrucomicrobiota bacterium]|nr:MotA/TolQ/ExbB proton channel family protein [Verrucomicrobiota bacterium]
MIENLPAKIWQAWVDGGWIMIPIALVALAAYASALHLLAFLDRRSFRRADDRQLRQWIARPESAPGELGELIRYTQDGATTPEEVVNRFAEVSAAKVPEVDRRLAFLNTLVGAAPLLGLLGTVLGMLVTFEAIAGGGGKMVDQMAKGISVALITTQMGLMVALPGLVLAYAVRRRRNEYVSFLARLEMLSLRHLRPGVPGMTRDDFSPSRDAEPEPDLPAPGLPQAA